MIQVLGHVSKCKDDASHLQVFDVSAILLWFDFLVVAVVAVWPQMYQELSVLPLRGYFPESLEFQCPGGCFFFQ